MQQSYAPVPTRNPVTWILVADGRRAQVYRRTFENHRIPLPGNAKHHHFQEVREAELIPVEDAEWRAEPLDSFEFGNHQLGRVHESAVPMRHAAEPAMDIRDEVRIRFMHRIAAKLNEAKQKNRFDRLVLVAPDKLLGELRGCLDQRVLDCVAAELHKNLSGQPAKQLAATLGDIA